MEVPERPPRPYFCAALLSTAAHYQGYADQRRAGSKLYEFKVGYKRHSVTYEEAQLEISKRVKWAASEPETARELDAWERVLRIIERGEGSW